MLSRMTEESPQSTVHDEQLTGLTQLLDVTRGLAALHELDDILKAVTSGACWKRRSNWPWECSVGSPPTS